MKSKREKRREKKKKKEQKKESRFIFADIPEQDDSSDQDEIEKNIDSVLRDLTREAGSLPQIPFSDDEDEKDPNLAHIEFSDDDEEGDDTQVQPIHNKKYKVESNDDPSQSDSQASSNDDSNDDDKNEDLFAGAKKNTTPSFSDLLSSESSSSSRQSMPVPIDPVRQRKVVMGFDNLKAKRSTAARETAKKKLHQMKIQKQEDAPLELPADVPISRYTWNLPTAHPRDPRGLANARTVATSLHNYDFLRKKMEDEIKMLKKSKDPEDQQRRQQLVSKLNRAKEQEKFSQVKQQFYKEQEDDVARGKRPIYASKKMLQDKVRQSKYQELEKSHKLEKYLKRKEKKKKSQEAHRMPNAKVR